MAQLDFIYPRATLESGSNETDLINIKGCALMGFVFPVGFNSSTISLKAKIKPDFASGGYLGPYLVVDPTTGNDVVIYTGGTEGNFVPVTPGDLTALQYFSIVSSSAANADYEIIVVARPLQ